MERVTNELHPAENLVVNQLFGTVSGLGMGFITFDWSQISLHWFATHGPLVGSSTYLCGLRGDVLACTTDPLLYQRKLSLLFPFLTRAPVF
jgi:hypothetical protein